MSTTIDVLLVIILLSVLLSLGSSRMMALVKTMALQGAVVSLVPIFLEQQRLTNDGILFFQLIINFIILLEYLIHSNLLQSPQYSSFALILPLR